MRKSLATVGLCTLLTHGAYANDVNGDLNTNIQDSTVDSNNQSDSTTNNYNSGPPGAMSNPVPTAMAPTMMGGGGNDSCLIPSSSGIQVSLFGIASGSMEQDPECNRRKDARLMGAPQTVGGLGLQVAGISVMCSDAEVFRAMALANTPCPISDIARGKLLVGREAFEMMRTFPEVYIVGYLDDQAFWDSLLWIGKELPDVEEQPDPPSLSSRFRRNTGATSILRRNDNQPTDDSGRDNEPSQSVENADGGS